MSTPENEPQNPQTPPVNPNPPQYGQIAPEGQNPQPGANQPNPYGQTPPAYGQQPSHNPYGQAPNSPYGQPPQAPTPYGQQPYAGGFQVPPQGGFATPQMPTERPKELNIAFWSILVAGVVNLIGFMTFNTDLVQQQLLNTPEFEQLMSESGMTIASLLSMVKSMLLIMGVVSLGIYILIAFMVRKGSGVARIFATILAGLSLFNLGSGLLILLAVALGIVGVVFAWLRPSSNYIAARRAARAAGMR